MKQHTLLFCGLLALVSCGTKSTDSASQEQLERKVLVAEQRLCQVPIMAPAQLRGKQDIAILPQVRGTLDAVLVQEGQKVVQGQPMFKVNPTAYQAAVENAEGAVMRAETEVRTQQLEVEAKKMLMDKNIISNHEYQVQENKLTIARAALAEAQAALKNAKNDLSHTTVVAPHNGVVGSINYRQGSLVGPEIAEPLTVVSDNSTIYAYSSIAEANYMYIVSTYGSQEAVIDSLPDFELLLNDGTVYNQKGRLETMSGIMDAGTGAISIRIAFPNPDGILVAGGSGQIQTFFDYNSIVIPRKATFDIQDKTFCYVAEQQDSTYVAKERVIQVYRLNEKEYLADGLQPGDLVITEGVKRITNGQAVKPVY